MSVDPLASDYASWSTYNYVLGNPENNIDPDGRAVEDCCPQLYGAAVGSLDNLFGTNIRGSVSFASADDRQQFNEGTRKADIVFVTGGTVMQVTGALEMGVGTGLAPETAGTSLALTVKGALTAGLGTWFQSNAARNLNRDDGIVQMDDGGSSKPKEIGPAGDVGGGVTKQIPEGWKSKTTKKGDGTHFVDPDNPKANNVRVMQGKPNSPNPSQQTDYVKQTKNGKVVDKN